MVYEMSMTLEKLNEILDAFNNKDLDKIIESFEEEGEFFVAAGPHPYGEFFKGHETIPKALSERFATVPDIQWLDVKTWISGDNGVSQWLVKGTGPNGPINQLGCDLWTFRGDKILKKDTYYKQVIA